MRISRDSPGERFLLRDTGIFQCPALAAVGALVHSASESGNVEHARIGRTRGVKKDVGYGAWLHPLIGFRPGLSTIVAAANAAAITLNTLPAPHFGAGQVVRPAIDAPNASLYLGVEFHSIGGVQPVPGHALGRGYPGGSSLL